MSDTTSVFKSICSRLQQLDCPLLGNCEDWWLEELFFTPGVHRIQLIEWFFTKLKFSSFKSVNEAHSPQEGVKDLLQFISALGLCQKSSDNLIQGNVTKTEHIRFWRKLVNLLWIKNQIVQNSSVENELQPSRADAPTSAASHLQSGIEEEYSKSCNYIKSLSCSGNTVNSHVNLFPIDVTKDIECILSSTPLDRQSFDLHSSSNRTFKDLADASVAFKESCCAEADTEFDSFDSSKFSDEFSVSSFTNCAEFIHDFTKFFDLNLKPVLRRSDHSFGPLGMQFSKLHGEQKNVKQHLDCLSSIKTHFNWLEGKSKSEPKFPELCLSQSESELDDYCRVMMSETKGHDARR